MKKQYKINAKNNDEGSEEHQGRSKMKNCKKKRCNDSEEMMKNGTMTATNMGRWENKNMTTTKRTKTVFFHITNCRCNKCMRMFLTAGYKNKLIIIHPIISFV